MATDDEEIFPACKLMAETFLSLRADGRTMPTLAVTTRTDTAPSSIRFSHAMALWGAARTELMLEKRGDCLWRVDNPAIQSRWSGGM
jgi:hypothetical protein